MKHKGSFEDLQTIVRAVGFNISEITDSGNQKQIRTEEGAIINWFPSTGTLQYQGKPVPKQRLQDSIATYTGVAVPNPPLIQTSETAEPQAPNSYNNENKKVFVVHGHDAVAREQLELVLHKLGLYPFVLQNTSGGGLTIIEALEQEIGPNSNQARFGIVLLTPDDMGYVKHDAPENAQPRARQNVILEMGMLISAVGRGNVAILKKGHIEIPSDANGILYIPFNEHVKETVPKLTDRLRAAGFVLNPSAITNASS
jgi:predicted nucleotide-binding protein